jgi:hypothetical protein
MDFRKSHFHILVVSAALAVSACAQKDSNKSVDTDGTCSTQFVADYNTVASSASAVQSAAQDKSLAPADVMTKLKAMKTACDSLLQSHANVTCRAEFNSESKLVSSADKKDACQTINKILLAKEEGAGKQQTPPEPVKTKPESTTHIPVPAPKPPVPAPGSAPSAPTQGSKTPTQKTPPKTEPAKTAPKTSPSSTIAKPGDDLVVENLRSSQIKVSVKNSEPLVRILTDKHELLMVDGKIVKGAEFEVTRGAVLCTLTSNTPERKKEWTTKLVTQQTLKTVNKTEKTTETGYRNLKLYLEDKSLIIDCLKVSSRGFLIKDIRNATKGILEFSVQK